MLISALSYRRFDTHAETVVRYWTVAGGSVTVLRIRWDPEGPLSAQDAARTMCEKILEAMGPRPAPSTRGLPPAPTEPT